jgi:hypothetical protein
MTFPQMCRWPPGWSITAAFDCHSRRRQHSALSRLSQRYLPEERDLNAQVQSEAIIVAPKESPQRPGVHGEMTPMLDLDWWKRKRLQEHLKIKISEFSLDRN